MKYVHTIPMLRFQGVDDEFVDSKVQEIGWMQLAKQMIFM